MRGALSACIPTQQKRDIRSQDIQCELPCECWHVNSGTPLEELSVLLINEPFLASRPSFVIENGSCKYFCLTLILESETSENLLFVHEKLVLGKWPGWLIPRKTIPTFHILLEANTVSTGHLNSYKKSNTYSRRTFKRPFKAWKLFTFCTWKSWP